MYVFLGSNDIQRFKEDNKTSVHLAARAFFHVSKTRVSNLYLDMWLMSQSQNMKAMFTKSYFRKLNKSQVN